MRPEVERALRESVALLREVVLARRRVGEEIRDRLLAVIPDVPEDRVDRVERLLANRTHRDLLMSVTKDAYSQPKIPEMSDSS